MPDENVDDCVHCAPAGYQVDQSGVRERDKDIGRTKELLKYRWFQKKAWQDEIKRRLAPGLK